MPENTSLTAFDYASYLSSHPELYNELDLADKNETEWIALLEQHYNANKNNSNQSCQSLIGPQGPRGCEGKMGPQGPQGPPGVLSFDFVPIYPENACAQVDLRNNPNINFVVYAPAKKPTYGAPTKQLEVNILHDESCIGKKGNIMIVNWDDLEIKNLKTVPDIKINQTNRFLCRNPRGELDYCYEVGSSTIENKDDDDSSNDIECVVFQNDIKNALKSLTNRKLPVYNYDLFNVVNQKVNFDPINNMFYSAIGSEIDTNISLASKRWFYKQNQTENIKLSDCAQFSISGQWYYVNEAELENYIKAYVSEYNNDLSLLPHKDNDFTNDDNNCLFCVGNCSHKYRKVRLTNIDVPLIAFEELTDLLDKNHNLDGYNESYTGNIPVSLKANVDFKLSLDLRPGYISISILNISDIKSEHDANPIIKQLHILRGTKNECPLWGVFDMSSASNVDGIMTNVVNFNKSLILDKSTNGDVTKGRWNKVLDVVVTSNKSIINSEIVGMTIRQNDNDLIVKAGNTTEVETNLVPEKLLTENNSVMMSHLSYDVALFNSKGNPNFSAVPSFVARLNKFTNNSGMNLLSVKLQSSLNCIKEFGNYKLN